MINQPINQRFSSEHFLNITRLTQPQIYYCITNILMIAERTSGKQRVKSVFVSLAKEENHKGNNKNKQITSNKGKVKREKRIQSSNAGSKNKRTQVRKQKFEHTQSKQKDERKSVMIQASEQEESKHHFMTVADLSCGDIAHQDYDRENLETPINDFNQESTIKTLKTGGKESKLQELSPVPLNPTNEISMVEKEKQLDDTIGKLKEKQQTIDILSRTIQTRLVEASAQKFSPTNRMDIYQVEMNFYIQRISDLQKELHEKNKILNSMAQKNAEYSTLTKNNRRLIGENHRLRQERNLLERQNQALKKLIMTKLPKNTNNK